jgi:hypothetical protein
MSNETAAASPETAPAAEEGSPEAAAALRAELGRVGAERDSLASQLKEARVKEQLLLNRVLELQAKYEPNVVRSPGFQRAFGSSGSAPTEPGAHANIAAPVYVLRALLCMAVIVGKGGDGHGSLPVCPSCALDVGGANVIPWVWQATPHSAAELACWRTLSGRSLKTVAWGSS